MRILNVFRSITVIGLVAIIESTAQQHTDNQLSTVTAEKTSAKQNSDTAITNTTGAATFDSIAETAHSTNATDTLNIWKTISISAQTMTPSDSSGNKETHGTTIAKDSIGAKLRSEGNVAIPADSASSDSIKHSASSMVTTGSKSTLNNVKTAEIPQTVAHQADSSNTIVKDSLEPDKHSVIDQKDTISTNQSDTTVKSMAAGLLTRNVDTIDTETMSVSDSLKEHKSAPKMAEPEQQSSDSQEIADTLITRLFTDFGMPLSNLSLDEAINYLLHYNPLVIAARLEWKSNERKALASLGAFEPAITGGYRYNYTGYSYRPFPEKNLDQSIGLKGRTVSGAEYSFDYRVTDIRNSRSSLELPQAFTGASVTQPLLRNAWYGSELADRKIAKIELETAYHTYRSKLIEMIAELQSAYWGLDFSQEKFRFSLQSVEIAEKVVEDGKMRVKAGKMSMADLMEAEAGLASRQANLADAGQELLDAANQLKLLLSTDDIGKDRLLFCTEKIFVDSSDSTIKVFSDTSAEFEVNNHPEYRIKKLELEKEAILFKYRTGQCLPGLNAKGSFGITGNGTKAPYAMYRMFHDPQPAWSAQLELELPVLGGVESRNLLIAQKLKKEAAQKNLSAIQYQIENTMRIITQRVAAHRDHAGNAESVVDYRQKLLDIEFKKLDAGKSNYRLIYETEEKLSQARMLQLESNVRYRMAIVQQAKVSGSMLSDFALETIEGEKVILTDRLTSRNWKDLSPENKKD